MGKGEYGRSARARSVDVLTTDFLRYRPELLRVAYHWMRGNPAAAEDLVSGTYLRLLKGAADAEPKSFPWYRKVMERERIKQYRKLRGRSGRWVEVPLYEDEMLDLHAEERLMERITLEQISRSIDTMLTDNERKVMSLAIFQGFTSQEIATMLRKNPVAVRTHYRNTMSKLAAAFGSATPSEGKYAWFREQLGIQELQPWNQKKRNVNLEKMLRTHAEQLVAQPDAEEALDAVGRAIEIAERAFGTNKQGKVFCLGLFYDLSPKQIAPVLGMTQQAVDSTGHLARKKMHATIQGKRVACKPFRLTREGHC